MSQPLQLTWRSIVPIMQFNYEAARVPGVYLWGFDLESKFVPYYVGIAGNIGERMCEHVSRILCGKYTLYHKNSLHKYWSFNKGPANPSGSSGMLYTPSFPEKYMSYIKNLDVLQEHAKFMVDRFACTYATADRVLTSADWKEVEKSVIGHFGERIANIRKGASSAFDITHTGCEQIFSQSVRVI